MCEKQTEKPEKRKNRLSGKQIDDIFKEAESGKSGSPSITFSGKLQMRTGRGRKVNVRWKG